MYSLNRNVECTKLMWFFVFELLIIWIFNLYLVHEINQLGGLALTGCYFTNLENIVMGYLKNTKQSIYAAVAWINFNIY